MGLMIQTFDPSLGKDLYLPRKKEADHRWMQVFSSWYFNIFVDKTIVILKLVWKFDWKFACKLSYTLESLIESLHVNFHTPLKLCNESFNESLAFLIYIYITYIWLKEKR